MSRQIFSFRNEAFAVVSVAKLLAFTSIPLHQRIQAGKEAPVNDEDTTKKHLPMDLFVEPIMILPLNMPGT